MGRWKKRLLCSMRASAIIAAAAYTALGVRPLLAGQERAGATDMKMEPVIMARAVMDMGTLKQNDREGIPEREPSRSMDWDSEESYLLAKLAMAEAEGEDTEGKALVMLVALNRVWSDDFPDTIEGVIMQEHNGVHQFSVTREGGRWYKVEPDEDCYKALELITAQEWDESDGALYFESRGDSSWHQNNLRYLFRHGGHYFYTDKEG